MHRVTSKIIDGIISNEERKEQGTLCLVLFFLRWIYLLAWCACAPKQASKSNEERKEQGTASEMIVAASCGTKNNNASLQSNN